MWFILIYRGEKKVNNKNFFSTYTAFNTCVIIKKVNGENLLLGVVILCARMLTFSHTRLMLKINCLIPHKPHFASCSPHPNITFAPTDTTCVTHFNDGTTSTCWIFFSLAKHSTSARQKSSGSASPSDPHEYINLVWTKCICTCVAILLGVIIIGSSVCACVCGLKISKPSTQVWNSQAKQWPWEECEDFYKQSYLQKRVI